MSEREKTGLNFILPGGVCYAYRAWYQVPAAGDVVMLGDPSRGEDVDMRYPARVLLIVWARREKSWAGEMLECDVHIAWDDEIKVPTLEEFRRG